MTDAPALPPLQYADLGEVRLAYYEVGERKGTPIIFCHGFPELAYSWRHQLEACRKAGRWAIAVNQRGYGGSSAPPNVEDYDIEHLTADLVALLDHVGAQKGVFCGHDWGGFVVWSMAMRHPDRTAGVIGVNTPHNDRAPADPIAIMRNRLGEQMYIVAFQPPGEAEQVLEKDVAKTMAFFLKRPPAGQPPSAGFASERKPGDPSVFPLLEILKVYDPAYDTRPEFLTPEEMQVFVDAFKASGFRGPVNWYRNFSRNWERSAGLDHHIRGIPCLMITAELDAVLPPSAAAHMGGLIEDLQTVLVEGSGHWTQQEKPEVVNAFILDWLRRRIA